MGEIKILREWPDKKPKRTTHWFEDWCQKMSMRPVCRVADPDGDILLADSHEPIRKLGIYRTGFAVNREGLEVGNYNDYPMLDFATDTRREGLQKRINEALAFARQTQQLLKESGYYDGEGKRRFSH